MPSANAYDLFISHAWTQNKEYDRLVDWLNSLSATTDFAWRNCSVPYPDRQPIRSPAELRAALTAQIRPANAVLVLAGLYVNYRQWIIAEVELAQALHKPIIAVVPLGAEQVPALVADAAAAIVQWDAALIVAAIREHAI